MYDNFDVLVMQLSQHVLRIARKDGRIELERRLRFVPARRRKSRSQVNHRVHRDLFLAEGIDDVQDQLFRRHVGVAQFAVRLLVTERPLGRHCRRR